MELGQLATGDTLDVDPAAHAPAAREGFRVLVGEAPDLDELASRKIAHFLRIRYGGTHDAKRVLGPVDAIRDAFIAIQAHLYQ